jgi:hypothetical protein
MSKGMQRSIIIWIVLIWISINFRAFTISAGIADENTNLAIIQWLLK